MSNDKYRTRTKTRTRTNRSKPSEQKITADKQLKSSGELALLAQQMDEVIQSQKPLAKVPIDLINLSNNIRSFSTEDESFHGLVNSIKESGLLQNPVLIPTDKDGFKFTCIAGHRRLTACEVLGTKVVVCQILYDLTEKEAFVASLAENLKRSDLTPYDILINVKKAREELEMDHQDISIQLNRKDRKFSERCYKAANWNEDCQREIKLGKINISKIQEIARESKTETEVLALLKAANKTASNKSSRKPKDKPKKWEMFEAFLEAKKYSKDQLKAIDEFIDQFKLSSFKR